MLSLYNYLFKEDYSDDFYYLSLLHHKQKGWSIHGLWRQYGHLHGDKEYPQFCKEVTFDLNSIKLLIPFLKEAWYSYDGKNFAQDESFWKHEWEKHGSCMLTDMDEHMYFQLTLDLFKQVTPEMIETFRQGNKCMIPVSQSFELGKKI